MADFFQGGRVATLHRLGKPGRGRLERELRGFAAARPMALVLPCHADELETPALRAILGELKRVPYLSEVVVGVDGADAAAWARAKRVFRELPQPTALLWNDGPRLKGLIRRLRRADLDPGTPGKGRNLWLGFGCVLAGGRAQVVAVHDCDIRTYSRDLLARLFYPVAHPHLGFDFCKGYSARFTDHLNGRVMRLLFTPTVRALQSLVGPQEFLTFLGSLRYPISGEACLDIDVVRRLRMPGDWGVETGMLAGVFRICSPKAICQIDLADCYDHKHRELSPKDPRRGLNKMACDIVRRIFHTLAGEGVKLDRGLFDALITAYAQTAEETMRFYAADAEVNGLTYDRHQEELAVSTFAGSIRTAARNYLQNPLGAPLLPDWNRVESALPDLPGALLEAVQADAH